MLFKDTIVLKKKIDEDVEMLKKEIDKQKVKKNINILKSKLPNIKKKI